MSKIKPWTDDEVAKLMRLYRHARLTKKYGFWNGIIAQMPGRSELQCRGKVRYQICGRQYREKYANYKTERPNDHRVTDAVIIVPADVIADAAYRRRLARPTVTAEFFGDPLPGYSALDRMLRR